MNYRNAIRDLLTDDEGNYKLGLEYAITPEKVLETMGVKNWTEKIYQITRTEINAVMKQICNEGYCTGGVGRKPTHYMIASNPTEERMIIKNYVKSNIGRLDLFVKRGQKQINTAKAKSLIKQLLKIENESTVDELFLE